MGIVNGTFIYQGQPRNGAEAKLWQAVGFEFPPEYDDDEPGAEYQEGDTITTSPTYGGDGAYRWLDVPNGEYYISCYYKDHRVWIYAAIETIAEILIEEEDLLVRRGDVLTRIPIENDGDVLTIVEGQVAWAAWTRSYTSRIAPSDTADDISITETTYTTKKTVSIPASEKSVYGSFRLKPQGDYPAHGRIVYNGVEMASVSTTTDYKHLDWYGDGVLSVADLLYQFYVEAGSTWATTGRAFSIT